MATLAVQEAPRNSVLASATFTAATASDTFPNTGEEVLLVQNTDAGTRDITVVPGGSGGQTIGDGTLAAIGAVGSGFTIPATTGFSVVGKLDRKIFGDSPVITPSAAGNVTYAVVRLK